MHIHCFLVPIVCRSWIFRTMSTCSLVICLHWPGIVSHFLLPYLFDLALILQTCFGLPHRSGLILNFRQYITLVFSCSSHLRRESLLFWYAVFREGVLWPYAVRKGPVRRTKKSHLKTLHVQTKPRQMWHTQVTLLTIFRALASLRHI